MQTYANFTVGGALSVNCHGRYVGLGPLVLSVRAIKLALHDGSVVDASRTENPELFFGAIGGYGALGVVVEVELDLAQNLEFNVVADGVENEEVRAALQHLGCDRAQGYHIGEPAPGEDLLARLADQKSR